jgi:hypothetical protein
MKEPGIAYSADERALIPCNISSQKGGYTSDERSNSTTQRRWTLRLESSTWSNEVTCLQRQVRAKDLALSGMSLSW